jgi:uncharacterized membrane protein YgcG
LALPEKEVYWSNAAVVQLLTSECNKLERGMYKLPTDGNMVPAVFRRPKLDCFKQALASRIETDGIEVVDTVAEASAGGSSGSSSGSSSGGGGGRGGASGAAGQGRVVLMDMSEGYFSSGDDASQWSQPSSYHSSDCEE